MLIWNYFRKSLIIWLSADQKSCAWQQIVKLLNWLILAWQERSHWQRWWLLRLELIAGWLQMYLDGPLSFYFYSFLFVYSHLFIFIFCFFKFSSLIRQHVRWITVSFSFLNYSFTAQSHWGMERKSIITTRWMLIVLQLCFGNLSSTSCHSKECQICRQLMLQLSR